MLRTIEASLYWETILNRPLMFLLKALTAFSSGLSFQGSLLSKQLWKIEGMSPSGAGADFLSFVFFFVYDNKDNLSLWDKC